MHGRPQSLQMCPAAEVRATLLATKIATPIRGACTAVGHWHPRERVLHHGWQPTGWPADDDGRWPRLQRTKVTDAPERSRRAAPVNATTTGTTPPTPAWCDRQRSQGSDMRATSLARHPAAHKAWARVAPCRLELAGSRASIVASIPACFADHRPGTDGSTASHGHGSGDRHACIDNEDHFLTEVRHLGRRHTFTTIHTHSSLFLTHETCGPNGRLIRACSMVSPQNDIRAALPVYYLIAQILLDTISRKFQRMRQ